MLKDDNLKLAEFLIKAGFDRNLSDLSREEEKELLFHCLCVFNVLEHHKNILPESLRMSVDNHAWLLLNNIATEYNLLPRVYTYHNFVKVFESSENTIPNKSCKEFWLPKDNIEKVEVMRNEQCYITLHTYKGEAFFVTDDLVPFHYVGELLAELLPLIDASIKAEGGSASEVGSVKGDSFNTK